MAILAAGFLGAVRESRSEDNIAWSASLDTAMQQAKQTRKPVLLSFRTPGCGWCKKMDAETFSDPQVEAMSRRYVCVRLDSEMEPETVARYGVFEYPLTLITDAQGKEILRIPGYVSPDRFAPALDKLAEGIKN